MTRRLLTIAAASAAVFVCSAAVSAQTLLSGFLTRHSHGEYRDSNPGIGIRIDSGPWANWAIGTYRNSLDRQTVYVVREWLWQAAGQVHVGVLAGAATGYRFAVVPALLPEAVLRFERFEVALIVQPVSVDLSPAFVAVQIRFDPRTIFRSFR